MKNAIRINCLNNVALIFSGRRRACTYNTVDCTARQPPMHARSCHVNPSTWLLALQESMAAESTNVSFNKTKSPAGLLLKPIRLARRDGKSCPCRRRVETARYRLGRPGPALPCPARPGPAGPGPSRRRCGFAATHKTTNARSLNDDIA